MNNSIIPTNAKELKVTISVYLIINLFFYILVSLFDVKLPKDDLKKQKHVGISADKT
jgi:hypothetical protein